MLVCALRNSKSKLSPGGQLDQIIGRDVALVEEFVSRFDKPENECGIYFHTATLKNGATHRVTENCSQFTSIFADVDDKNHELTRDQVLERLDECGCPPSIVVDSGHGLQPYWLLVTASEDIDLIVRLRKKLQSITASDAVHDAPRVMRLPGTHNTKVKGEELEARIIYWHPERRYSLEELEAWMNHEGAIIPQKAEAKPKTNGHDHSEHHHGGAQDYAPADVDRIHEALRHIDPSPRDTWRDVGMALKDELGDAGRALWDEWSKSCDKYNELDQNKNWRSFGKRHGVTIATLFHYAKQGGWQSERARARNEYNGTEQTQHKTKDEQQEKSTGGGSPEIDIDKIYVFLGDAPHTPPRELINGLIPAEGVAVTGGQSTAGKTFEEIYKAICLATGLPYFGRNIVERVGTVFVAAEGRALLPNRFAAALIKLSIQEKLPITWPKLLPDFSNADGIKLFIRQLKAIDERYRSAFGVRLGHVPIDTIAATFGMKDEDDNAEVTKICNVLRSIGDETGALLAPVHHYGKNPESGLRGASAWKGSADIILGVLADIDPLTGKTSNRELVCAKARDGEQGPISPFDLEFIELGLKDNGEIYGSCCVVPKNAICVSIKGQSQARVKYRSRPRSMKH